GRSGDEIDERRRDTGGFAIAGSDARTIALIVVVTCDATGALAERTGFRVGKAVEGKSRKGRKTGSGSDIREKFSTRRDGASSSKNCPGRWLSALIARRLSCAAIGGK